MQGFGSPSERLNRFARRLTIVVYKSDTVSIAFQDPKYDSPHMLPLNLDEAVETLKSQNLKRSLSNWQLPNVEVLELYAEQLLEEGEITFGTKKVAEISR